MHTFNENYAIRKAWLNGTAGTGPAFGPAIELPDAEGAFIWLNVNDTVGDVYVELYESGTSDMSAGTLVPSAVGTIDGTTDATLSLGLEVGFGQLNTTSTHIALRITAAEATSDVSGWAVFHGLNYLPATNGTSEGFAGIVELVP